MKCQWDHGARALQRSQNPCLKVFAPQVSAVKWGVSLLTRTRTIALVEELYRMANKFDQQLINLTRAYTDPDIQMTKAQYLVQKNQLEAELREVHAGEDRRKSTPDD